MKWLTLRANKLWVFLHCNFRREAQNLVGFSAKYFWIFVLCFAYGSFFKTALWQKSLHFKGHTIDFPLFFVSGLVVARMIPFSIRIVEDTLSQLRNSGLIEWILVTPTNMWELFIAKALWNGVSVLVEVIVMVGSARIWIGTPIRPFLQLAVIQPVILMFLSYAGIGMVISGLSLFFRRGSFLFTAFFQISAIFGGVFFPTEIFTKKLKLLVFISHSLPITPVLEAVRLALIHEDYQRPFIHRVLPAFTAFVCILAGFIVLYNSLIWARKNGKFSKELYN